VGADLLRRQAIDVRQALVDQLDGAVVDASEVVRCVELALRPVEAEPAHVALDRLDVLGVFLDRVGVVEAQIAQAAELGRDAEVQTDRLRVPTWR